MKENNEINSNKKDSKLKLVITILLIIILIGTTAYFAYNYFKIQKAQENLNNNSTKNQEVITPTNNANDVENNNNNNLVNTILENEGGAITSDKNTDFYLYSGSAYWTSTPISFGFPMAATVDSLDETGRIADNRVDVSSGIRPVINIINTAKFTSGNGTNNSPYIIEE